MQYVSTARRLLEAIITAIGVVLGLVPDPTLRPVPVTVDASQEDRGSRA